MHVIPGTWMQAHQIYDHDETNNVFTLYTEGGKRIPNQKVFRISSKESKESVRSNLDYLEIWLEVYSLTPPGLWGIHPSGL